MNILRKGPSGPEESPSEYELKSDGVQSYDNCRTYACHLSGKTLFTSDEVRQAFL